MIASHDGGRQPSRQPATPIPGPDRLHELAYRIERLGISGRLDPESVLVTKSEIAEELRALARWWPTR